MGGTQDKRQEPGKGREEQQRPQRPGQDPAHPQQPGQPSRGKIEETTRRREGNPLHEERDLRDDEL